MNEHEYRGSHVHAIDPTVVEIVAYQRKDRDWDVFVCEPEGSCPELESNRIDVQHIFIQKIKDVGELVRIAGEIEECLGTAYQRTDFYREIGTRRIIQAAISHLQRRGAFGMQVRAAGENEWILSIRKKDIPLASEVVATNL